MIGYAFTGLSDREIERWVATHPIAGGQGPFTGTTAQTQTFPGSGDPATMDATRRAYLAWLRRMGISQERIAELTGTGPQGVAPALSDIYAQGGANLATLGGRAGTVGAAPLNLPAFARPITQNLTENILPGLESRALFVGAPFGGRAGDLTARALREYGTAIGDVESRAELARRQQELSGIAEAGTLGTQATGLKAQGALTPLTLALQGIPAPVPIPQPSGPQTATSTATSEPSDFEKLLGITGAATGLYDLYRAFVPAAVPAATAAGAGGLAATGTAGGLTLPSGLTVNPAYAGINPVTGLAAPGAGAAAPASGGLASALGPIALGAGGIYAGSKVAEALNTPEVRQGLTETAANIGTPSKWFGGGGGWDQPREVQQAIVRLNNTRTFANDPKHPYHGMTLEQMASAMGFGPEVAAAYRQQHQYSGP